VCYGVTRFALSFSRHTGKDWVGIFDDQIVDVRMKAIRDESWFQS
jgi:hypothetical protein